MKAGNGSVTAAASQKTKIMPQKTTNKRGLGITRIDVEVDWGGFEPPTS
jgi:hypothetical protein